MGTLVIGLFLVGLCGHFVSNRSAPTEVKPLLLMEDNSMCIIKGDYRACGIIGDFACKLKQMGRV